MATKKETQKYVIKVIEDYTGYIDYYSGHGHCFDDKVLGCIRAHVTVNPLYKEKVGEIEDMFISECNMMEIDFLNEAKNNLEMQEEINNFVTNDKLRKKFWADMQKGVRKNMFYFSERLRKINVDTEIDEECDEFPQVVFIVHIYKAN